MSARAEAAKSVSAGAAVLEERIAAYLRAHHVMTLATVGAAGSDDEGRPHAASVFYAMDSKMRLVFLSKASSTHARHVAAAASGRERPDTGAVAGDRSDTSAAVWVAASVAEEYSDWAEIQGVQIGGRVEVLRGRARAGAMLVYVRRFPFVRGFFRDPRFARLMAEVEVFRLIPVSLALTDNRVGPFGRETLLLDGGPGAP